MKAPTLSLVSVLLAPLASAQFFNDFDQPPHDYWQAKMHDPMSVLMRGVEGGERELPDENGLPLVLELLEELDIPVESQVLVFSRTSLQRGAVSPDNPRAIFFNEETYLGWMPGGRIEIASSDPERGAVFFFQRKLDQQDGSRFFRDRVCIQCHAGSATNFLPGLLGRSVYPDARGRSLRAVESFERVGHGVPLRDRWGGWYVTGAPAGLEHLGNAIAKRGGGGVELGEGATPEELAELLKPGLYPRQDSDVVALLVLDHQVSMQFELMQASYVARQIAADAGWKSLETMGELAPETKKEFDDVVERVVKHLLFSGEASLGELEFQGAGDFQGEFAKRGKRDPKGRSLRDFDLDGNMFRYRCSFMIHSGSFTGMPGVTKTAILERLRAVLTAGSPEVEFKHLAAEERQAILEILTATVPDFPSS